MSTMSATKCSKRAGEYCRLHNPSPSKFTTVNDVFKAVDGNKHSTRISPIQPVETAKGQSFQRIDETRTLAGNVPANLEEHVAQSKLSLAHLSDEKKKALRGYTGFGAGVCNSILLGQKYEYYDEAPKWRESNAPCDFVDREDLVDYMETIDTILETRQEEQRIVYRGIPIYKSLHDEIGASIGKNLHISDTEGLVEGLKEYYKPGKVFNYGTYLSTTLSAHYAAERTDNSTGTKQSYYDKEPEIKGIQFELKTNAGLDVTGAAGRPYVHEREVVLPRDTHFKVVNVHVKPKSYDTVSGYDHDWEPDEIQKANYENIAVVVQMVEVDSQGNEITHTNPHKPRIAIEDIVPKD